MCGDVQGRADDATALDLDRAMSNTGTRRIGAGPKLRPISAP
jgi:hypothetical protein